MPQSQDVKLDAMQLATGIAVQYAEAGDPAGEPVVFLHGFTDSWFSFSRILQLLPREYRALALTLRGHGDSDKPECCYTIDDFVGDVVAFLDACDIDQATIVGMSGGSFIAQRVAVEHAHRVSRLVLISSAATLHGNEAAAELGQEMLALKDPISPEFVTDWQRLNIYAPVPDEFFATVVSESLKLPARVWGDFWTGVVLAPDYSSRLGEIDVPTLIISGELDAVFSREDSTRLAAAIPNATLKVYPETGHTVHWERPEEVVRDLVGFLAATAPHSR
jgi:non-heme chloroperoxidase